MGSLFQPKNLMGVCKSRYQDRFTASRLLQWTHALVFAPGHSIPAAFMSLPLLSTWLFLHTVVCSSSRCAHLLPGKEVVKQDHHGEPHNWGCQRKSVGRASSGGSTLSSVVGKSPLRDDWGLNISTASREAHADPQRGGPLLCAALGGTKSNMEMS